MSRKGGTGGGTWPCLGLAVERPWLAPSGLFPYFIGLNGLRNKPSDLVGPPFLAFGAHFSAIPCWCFLGALIESLLSGGCG